MPSDPTRIGPYTILQRIGEGAAGMVYLADVDPRRRPAGFSSNGTPRLVALKIYKPDILQEPKQRERIDREFRIGKTLDSPYVVRVIDHGTDDQGQLYLVMEYVDGRTVSETVALYHPLSSRLILAVMEDLVDGLSELHDRRIIHRDIKPSNIMLTPDFQPKLMDFGVALPLEEDERLTDTDVRFLGTKRNSAPERLDGGDATELTDLYSLGTVCFCLLFGCEPFEKREPGHAADIVARVRAGVQMPNAPPEDGVFEGLSSLAKRLLAKDPRDRPQSCTEVRDVLAALGEKAAQTKAPTPLYGYVACALTGLDDDAREAAIFVSSKIADVAKKHQVYIYQPRKVTDPVLNTKVPPKEVYRLDRKNVVACDLLVVLANHPSFGVGQELEIAAQKGIPTLIATRGNPERISRMVLGSPNPRMGVFAYLSPENLEEQVRRYLDEHVDWLRRRKEAIRRFPKPDVLPQRLRDMVEAKKESFDRLAEQTGLSASFLEGLAYRTYEDIGVEPLLRVAAALDEPIASLLATVPGAPDERDGNILALERVARKEAWSMAEYLDVREDYWSAKAALSDRALLDERDWKQRRLKLLRRQAEEEREDEE